jgi:glucose-1-phosphate cytidylyltransferase
LNNLANNNNLMAFSHEGFWHPMDTLRDMNYLQELWDKGIAPWKIW